MKVDEAILRIKCHNEFHSRQENPFAVRITEALNIAVKALEKQTLKQVRNGESSSVKAFDGENKILTYRCYPCPTCGKWIIDNENHKYCQWCGQALDWSARPTEKGGVQE